MKRRKPSDPVSWFFQAAVHGVSKKAVGFAEQGSWSYIGTDALSDRIPQDKPTINFHGLDERVDQDKRKLILEEFGHVLGFLHAEQDPKSNCRAELNLDYFKAMGLSEKDIERRYFPPEVGGPTVPNSGEYISTGIDNRSIMRLFTKPEQFKDGEKNRCYGPPTDTISELDRELAKLLYPLKPPDVSATTDAKQLTIRFEGALAAEHFGYVVSALYDIGKIKLTKHVALQKQGHPRNNVERRN